MAGGGANAQGFGLRGSDSSGGFPTSPADVAPYVPDSNSPPSLGASPADAETTAPATSYATPATTDTDADDTGPNYGKPRKKRAKLYAPNPKTSVPLAPLVPYRGAPGPQQRRLNPVPAAKTAVDPTLPGPTVAVLQSPLRMRHPPVEDDPYAPLGVRFGTLRLLPFVEASAGYESNPNQINVAIKPSADLRVDGGVAIASDFSSGSLTANLRGGYSEFPSNSTANRPDFAGIVDGRIDVTRNDTIDLEARSTLATQTPGSPSLALGSTSTYITDRPTITSEGGTVGVTHIFNRLAIGVRSTFDRTQYGDATQSDGSIYRYSQDNFDDYGLVLRASYELTPGLVPFTEVGADDRVRDNAIDLSGYARDSRGIFARAGTSFEFGRIITGTLSAGYADRHYADARLPNLRGPTLDGSLVYAVTPITAVTFRASTTLAETTLPGASGAISRLVSLELSHIFFRNFTVSGIVTYQPNEYQGVSVNEAFSSETLKAAYAFNREVSLIATASHQQLATSLTFSAFKDNVFLLGVRLQR